VLEREGPGREPLPGLASQQLALTLDDRQRSTEEGNQDEAPSSGEPSGQRSYSFMQ
jgi:hypothetical protein